MISCDFKEHLLFHKLCSENFEQLNGIRKRMKYTSFTKATWISNKIGKVYSFKYTDIPGEFFTIHITCTTVIQG